MRLGEAVHLSMMSSEKMQEHSNGPAGITPGRDILDDINSWDDPQRLERGWAAIPVPGHSFVTISAFVIQAREGFCSHSGGGGGGSREHENNACKSHGAKQRGEGLHALQHVRAIRVQVTSQNNYLNPHLQYRPLPHDQGCQELCSFLDSNNIPRGLITRNVMNGKCCMCEWQDNVWIISVINICTSGVDHFHKQHLTPLELRHFKPAISRECDFAYKV